MGGSLSRAPGDHFFLPIEGVDFEVVAPSNTAIVDPPTEGAGAGGSSSAVYPIKNLQRCEGYFLAQGGEEIHKVLMPVKFPLFKRLKREKAVARALGVTDRGALPKHVTYENDHMELGRDGCLRIEAVSCCFGFYSSFR